MTTTACPCPQQPPLRSEAAVPVRSPRTSLILAEAARQRRWERRQRREGRVRRAAWCAVFDRRPFDLVRTGATAEIVFSNTALFVYAVPAPSPDRVPV